MIADLSGRPPLFGQSSNAFLAVAGRARSTPNSILALAEVIGFAGALAVFATAPHRAELAFPAISVGAFGLWGITDHLLSERSRTIHAVARLTLEGFRFSVAAAGIAAALAFGYALIGMLMGTWIL